MKARSIWNEHLLFTSTVGSHSFVMDAIKPLGADTAATPKELVLAALCGCTGMDVVSLMRKHHQPIEGLSVDAEAESRDTYPTIFTAIHLHYKFKGAVDPRKAKEAVQLSESRYCSVSAMISCAVPIDYTIEINGEIIAKGEAQFEGAA